MTHKSWAAMGLNTAKGYKIIKPKFTVNKTTVQTVKSNLFESH